MLEQQIGQIKSIYANLLTKDDNGKFPFYELVVKPFFGGMTYYEADQARYLRCGIHSQILDSFLSPLPGHPSPRIWLRALSEQLRKGLGEVRPETKGAERNLERFDFRRSSKHDILDGGQYFEIEPEQLKRRTLRPLYVAQKLKRREIQEETAFVTFAPSRRPWHRFKCARARARIEDEDSSRVRLAQDAEAAFALQMISRAAGTRIDLGL